MLSTLRTAVRATAPRALSRSTRQFSRSMPRWWDLAEYRQHVKERAELGTLHSRPSLDLSCTTLSATTLSFSLPHLSGVVPKPLTETQVADLIELLKNPPAGEEATLVDLIKTRVPAGVDQAAYVKASFLTSVVKVLSSSVLVQRLP